MMIGRAPRESNPKWLQSQCKGMISREEMEEKMEEKRGEEAQGWLGFWVKKRQQNKEGLSCFYKGYLW